MRQTTKRWSASLTNRLCGFGSEFETNRKCHYARWKRRVTAGKRTDLKARLVASGIKRKTAVDLDVLGVVKHVVGLDLNPEAETFVERNELGNSGIRVHDFRQRQDSRSAAEVAQNRCGDVGSDCRRSECGRIEVQASGYSSEEHTSG